METTDSKVYVKRTQKDYTTSFKIQVVNEVESGAISATAAQRKYGIQGRSTVLNWIRKYGIFDRELLVKGTMKKSPEQELIELKQKVEMLERQKRTLEKQLEFQSDKAVFFDMMIDLAEKEFKIPIRKKSLPEQSTIIDKKKQNR